MSKKAPSLETLKSKACSLQELQAAIVELIDLHNKLDARVTEYRRKGMIRSERESLMNTPYGI